MTTNDYAVVLMQEVIRVRLESGSFSESRKSHEAAIRNSPAPNQPPQNMPLSQNVCSTNQKLVIINDQNELLSKVNTLKLVKVKLCLWAMNTEIMQLLVIFQSYENISLLCFSSQIRLNENI